MKFIVQPITTILSKNWIYQSWNPKFLIWFRFTLSTKLDNLIRLDFLKTLLPKYGFFKSYPRPFYDLLGGLSIYFLKRGFLVWFLALYVGVIIWEDPTPKIFSKPWFSKFGGKMRDSLLSAASKTNKSILNIRQLVQEVLKMKRDARALSFMWIWAF